jgi:hypothetical protein
MEFSISSLTTEPGRSITSPAAILLMTLWDSLWIIDDIITRVNITELTPHRIIAEKEIISSNPAGKIIRKIKK